MATRVHAERKTRTSPPNLRTEFANSNPNRTAVPSSPAVSRRELLRLLNEDFARECQGVFAYAVYAERYRNANPMAAAECEARGEREVAHAMALCQLVYDFGGAVTASVDDREAVRHAARVVHPGWQEETVRRLRERADQLRAAGRPQLASRLLHIIRHEESAEDLGGIVRRHPSPAGR